MKRLAIACAAAAMIGCSNQHTLYHMRDHFHACVAPDGRPYMVEYEDGDCRPGDAAARCALPGGNVVDVRAVTATTDCANRGGRVLQWSPATAPTRP